MTNSAETIAPSPARVGNRSVHDLFRMSPGLDEELEAFKALPSAGTYLGVVKCLCGGQGRTDATRKQIAALADGVVSEKQIERYEITLKEKGLLQSSERREGDNRRRTLHCSAPSANGIRPRVDAESPKPRLRASAESPCRVDAESPSRASAASLREEEIEEREQRAQRNPVSAPPPHTPLSKCTTEGCSNTPETDAAGKPYPRCRSCQFPGAATTILDRQAAAVWNIPEWSDRQPPTDLNCCGMRGNHHLDDCTTAPPPPAGNPTR